MKIENGIFSTMVPLYSFQTDSYNQAHLVSYLQILQEAAARHSYERKLGVPQLREQGMTWVLARTKVTISQYASWPTDLDILTWPQEPWKLYFPRGTKIAGPDGGELCRSLSQWVVMDLSSRRPVNLNGHVNNIVYAQWIFAGLPHSFLDSFQAAEFDISYLAETQRNDSVMVRTGAVDVGALEHDFPVLTHEIVKTLADGATTPVCIARTTWRRREPLA
jgi:acyl-ACP thioesterase